jgi:uncharacterized protein (TIGR03083 family)
LLSKSQYLESLAENVDQFVAAAELGLEPRVSACPEWTVGQLVVHLGDVYDFWSRLVENRIPDEAGVKAMHEKLAGERTARDSAAFSGSERALEYFRDRAAAIQRVLLAADPGQANWTWWPPNQTAGFVQRRMAHETTIHRWDAQAAHGVQQPVSPATVAADGIDEYLRNGLTGWPDEEANYAKASFHIHCTDTDGEWLIRAAENEVALSPEHAKADVAITGPATNLLLWLWERIPADGLIIHGDAELLDQLKGMIDRE